MKMKANPFKCDEFVESHSAGILYEAMKLDPLKPEEGYYYLWDELEGKIFTSIYGKDKFSSLEAARFARSCSTRWPFLQTYRHWNHSQSRQQAQARHTARQQMHELLLPDIQKAFDYACDTISKQETPK